MSPFVSLVGWLFGCMVYVCLCVCVSAFAAHFCALFALLETFFFVFLALQRLWDSIVTLGAPLCHLWWVILHDFGTWWRLGTQFADF